MHILVVHQYFLGKNDAGGSRWNQFAKYWSQAGHKITVLAGMAHYSIGKKLPLYKGKFIVRERERENVDVLRCYVSGSYNKNFIGRFWAYMSFTFSTILAGLFYTDKCDVIICTSPPLTVGFTGWVLSKLRKVAMVFEVRDLWPESTIGIGVLTNKWLIKMGYWLERKSYNSANWINVLTPAFEKELFGKKYSRTQGKWKYPLSLLRARRLISKLKPDILHTHYVTSGGLAALMCGFHPVITTVYGSDINFGIKSRIWKLLLKIIFKYVDCINTCTEDQKRKVLSLGIKPKKIRLVNPGVDSEMFSFCTPKPIENRPLKLVTTRSLEPIYGHTTIIKALSFVRDKKRDFIMTFVAGGSMLNELKYLVDKEGLAENVKFLGGVDKNQIVSILHENDVFISSPVYDGISVALLEAMSVGLFPIASDIEVNSNWIEHGVEGFLHETGDPQSLANCILETYDNPQLIMGAANRNRQKILELADTSTNMKEIENIYKDLIGIK